MTFTSLYSDISMECSDLSLTDEPSIEQPPARSDRGFTFVETVLTVVLLGIVVVPVLAAVRGAIRVSAVTSDAAAVETVLVNAADRVQRAPDTSCDLAADAAAAAPADWPASSVSVVQEYLDLADGGAWVTGTGARGPACPDSTYPADEVVKRITITVSSPDGSVRRHIQVVTSNV